MSTAFRSIRRVISILTCVAGLVSVGGCQSAEPGAAAPAESKDTFSVRLDRTENGAAATEREAMDAARSGYPRKLAFRVVGSAPQPGEEETGEQRASARQAAIIEAFSDALSEARRSRGQRAEDFTARLGPRLTVSRETIDGGQQTQVTLISRGVTHTIVVRDGVLQHPPVDLRVIRRIFDETNGEFTLLGTDTSSNQEVALATVGCYLPAGFDPALPRNIAQSTVEQP